MRKINIWMWIFAILGFSSCSNWLDVQPAEEMGVEDMYSSPAGFKDALTACYIKLYSDNLYGKRLTQTDIEFLAQHWELQSQNDESRKSMKNFEYTAESVESVFQSIYKEMYNVIAQANAVLNKFDEYGKTIESDNLRKLIEGELLAIRAFCHTDILRLFGQLPQNATRMVSLPYAEEVTIASIPLYSFEEYVERIFRDVRKAEELLKESDPLFQYTYAELDDLQMMKELEDEFFLCRRFRFNYYSLKALEARLYLYLGDKTKAYTAATEVIEAQTGEGDMLLQLAGVDDIAAKNYTLPTECILALNKADMNGVLDNSLFISEEVRKLWDGQPDDYNRKVWWQKTFVNNEYRILFQKYRQPETGENVDNTELMTRKQIVPLFRLSEMYLIAMETAQDMETVNRLYEAYMRAREIKVLTSLQTNELEGMLEDEYRREFWGEGQMFYWYKRHQSKRMKWKTDRELVESDYIVPLPKTEIKTN